jgi:glycosyltransferase involved in cell wall biosynthesis
MISIITINYNNYVGLVKTVESVLNQTFNDFEFIVIDGGSNDNSVEFLIENSNKISKWYSENDNGIYDAMNKGINKSTGEYLLFLNSGDTLYNKNVLYDISEKICDYDVISGKLLMLNKNGTEIILEPHNKINYCTFVNSFISHPSTFIRKNLFFEYGFYETNYKIAADHAFFFNIFSQLNISYLPIRNIISIHELGGLSSNSENDMVHQYERKKILFNVPEFYKPLLKNENNNVIKLMSISKIVKLLKEYFRFKI